MRIWAIGFAMFAVAATAHSADGVGWRFTVESDPSRSYSPAEGDLGPSDGRPVAITLWYPAAEGGTRTTFADLARLGAYQRYGHPPTAAFDEATTQAINDTAPDALAGSPLGHQGATPSVGKYPLLLFAHSTPLGQVSMAEALVNRGFVVAGIMSRGAKAGAYRLSIDDIHAMSEDLDFARRSVASLPYVDTSRVGVIGMSNGALAAVGLANRTRIRAVVSLDGTVGEQSAARVLPALPDATATAGHAPLLHLYTTGNAYLDFSELRKRRAQCVAVKIPDIRHADFLSYALLKPPVARDPARVDPKAKFGVIQRLTADFLSQLVGADATRAHLELGESEKTLGVSISPCSA